MTREERQARDEAMAAAPGPSKRARADERADPADRYAPSPPPPPPLPPPLRV